MVLPTGAWPVGVYEVTRLPPLNVARPGPVTTTLNPALWSF